MDEKKMNELLKYTRALLLMQLRASSNPKDQLRPEIVLARAGFVPREIAAMVGKNPAAIAKAIQRAGTEAE
jgi:hypothetical protein